jgi:chemotaxis protein methyltransferase CheR
MEALMFQDLHPREFEKLADLIFRSSGIHLKPEKNELLRARLSKRLRALNLGSFAEYWNFLKDDEGDELRRMLDQVTTNKTEFFREAAHFDHLCSTALPLMLPTAEGPRIWSAACSSGEEPYTLAMVLSEKLEALGRPTNFKIVATDLSERILQRAIDGVYSEEASSPIPTTWRQKYFEASGPRSSQRRWRVKDELRSKVSFARFNLVHDPLPVGVIKPFDAIFCRNVMIYFDRPTQEAVIQRLSQLLKPKGWLYSGLSESLIGIRHGLKTLGASVYRKVDAAAGA